MSAFKEFLQQQATELPRLPVPPLPQTMQRYLRSVQPLLSAAEFRVTEELCAKFSAPGGIGQPLQKELEERAARTDNWLSEWWLNAAYLELRVPLPVYCNTSIVYPRQEFTSKIGQLEFAAALIASSLDFKAVLDQNKLPVERIGPLVLDMSQFTRVFSVCRIPGEGRDRIRLPDTPATAKHIVVAHNNHFFSVPVYGEQGEVLNQSQILAQLTDVVAQSPHPSPTPVGILTSENRDTWSKAREALIKADEGNVASLDMIETALLMVCLDGPPSQLEQEAPDFLNAAALRMMHGGGSSGNSANRWFDIVSQFIIGPSGEVGLSYEHSPGDSHPVITDHMETYWTKYGGSADPVPPAGKFTRPQHLQFTVSGDVQDAITTAQRNMDKLMKEIEINCFIFTDYGKDFIKTLQLGSPDSYIQMAIQLAFYRLHKVPGAQYESATTRKFLHGRTETIRSCSLESVLFARTMLDPAASDVDKAGALRAAMIGHREYIMNAVSGQGVDRHLLGLRLAAAEVGMEVPQLFLDAGYIRSGHMRLSTSQVPAINNTCGFFAPLVPDGYSCCYNIRGHEIVFGTSAFSACPETSAAEFRRALETSLVDMRSVLKSSLLQDKL